MPDKKDNDNKNEFDFLPPAEAPPAFAQEKDSYHEQVDAEDFGMVEDFGLQMEYSDEDMLPREHSPIIYKRGLCWCWWRWQQDGRMR